MRKVRVRGMIVLLLVPLTLIACGAYRERSLCRQYEDFQEAVAEVQAIDPDTATSEDVTTIADDVLAELDQLQSASDGLYDSLISNLRASLTELRQVADALGETDLDVARPLLIEKWDDVQVDYQLLTQRLDVVCTTD